MSSSSLVDWSTRITFTAVFVVALANLAGSLTATRSEPRAGDAAPGPLRFGMCTAITGPAADLGRGMRLGFEAAFAECNRAGGVGSRKLELLVLDDGYEPERTEPHVRRLVKDENVLAIVGDVGTPTAIAALPIAASSGTPFFAPFTGAGVLRKTPPDRNVFNFRASYAEETAAMIGALVEFGGLRCEEIALFTQRDSFGDACYSGVIEAMKSHGLRDEHSILHVRYERNTVAVERAVADILLAQVEPKAILLTGAYMPCAAFIRELRHSGCDADCLCVSFVGAASLVRELGRISEGVFITQVVPPVTSDLPVVGDYRAALAAIDPTADGDLVSLEGYVSGRILIRALQKTGTSPSRADLTQAFEQLGTFDVGLGTQLHLDAASHQACHRVWFTVVHDGQVVPCAPAEVARTGGVR